MTIIKDARNRTVDEENLDLVEYLRKLRARRAYEKLVALKGKIHLNIDIDALRGRTRGVEEPPVVPRDEETFDPVEELRKARARRAYEKAMALKGKIHLNIDIDELRGRKRR